MATRHARKPWIAMSAALGLAFMLLASVARAGPDDHPPRSCPWDGRTGTVAVRWGQATRTGGCFFFSGPADLGRDDHLGARAHWTRSANQISLSFGNGITFSGHLEGAASLVLTRVSTHQYGGPWTVTETIRGTLVERDGCATLQAQYHYDECNGQSCPGHCHIDAPLRLGR